MLLALTSVLGHLAMASPCLMLAASKKGRAWDTSGNCKATHISWTSGIGPGWVVWRCFWPPDVCLSVKLLHVWLMSAESWKAGEGKALSHGLAELWCMDLGTQNSSVQTSVGSFPHSFSHSLLTSFTHSFTYSVYTLGRTWARHTCPVQRVQKWRRRVPCFP